MLKNSNYIYWDGNNIDCLNVCKGDLVDDVVYKLCKLYSVQLETLKSLKLLNYSCFDDCNNCKDIDTISEVFIKLLSNDKQIKLLIDEKIDLLDNSEKYLTELDLKCLLNYYINSDLATNNNADLCNLNLDINSTFQLLINKFCELLDANIITNDNFDLIKLEFDTFVQNNNVYIEPVVNSCLSTIYNVTPHIENVTDPLICNIYNKLGDTTVNVCNFKNPIYFTNSIFPNVPTTSYFSLDSIFINNINYPAFTPYHNVNTIADLVQALNEILNYNNLPGIFINGNNSLYYEGSVSQVSYTVSEFDINNLPVSHIVSLSFLPITQFNSIYKERFFKNIKIAGLLQKVKKVENCCKLSCDKIKLGYRYKFDSEQEIYILEFRPEYNNIIPESFVSIDSTVTLIDHTGKTYVQSIYIESSFEFVLNTFDLDISKPINMTISGVFESDLLNCSVCDSGILLNNSSKSCELCKICAVGTEGSRVQIFYTSNGRFDIQSIMLYNDNCFSFNNSDSVELR